MQFKSLLSVASLLSLVAADQASELNQFKDVLSKAAASDKATPAATNAINSLIAKLNTINPSLLPAKADAAPTDKSGLFDELDQLLGSLGINGDLVSDIVALVTSVLDSLTGGAFSPLDSDLSNLVKGLLDTLDGDLKGLVGSL